MYKIAFLPLDERPCNYKFPSALFESADMHISKPEILGEKKTPAEYKDIENFLRREVNGADGLVVSLEMLLYGGLIPSRLHMLSEETLLQRLELLRELKREYPNLKIFGFNCIMRCPTHLVTMRNQIIIRSMAQKYTNLAQLDTGYF